MTNEKKNTNSLWSKTAVPQPKTEKLNKNLETEYAIIGAGFTGISAALHLVELGKKVIVLEAKDIGHGGSGRNGGQVNPGLKISPKDLEKKFGHKIAKNIFRSTENSADFVFKLVKKYQLKCNLRRTGFIYASESKKMLYQTEKRYKWLQDEKIDVEMLDAKETSQRVGHDIYCGSMFDPRGGSLQPLSYVRELARTTLSKGASIYTNTPVTQIKKINNKWELISNEGKIKAKKVLICTNAYSDMIGNNALWQELSSSIVPVYSFQVATEPIHDDLKKTILPSCHTVSNTRRLMLYYSYDHQNRFIMGGRGNARDKTNIESYRHLINKVSELFPSLINHKIEYYWSGKVAITTDGMPHIHNPAKGIYAGIGLNGRGVAMGTLLGKWLANAAMEKMPEDAIPFTKIQPIPFHRWHSVGVNIATKFKYLQDKLGI